MKASPRMKVKLERLRVLKTNRRMRTNRSRWEHACADLHGHRIGNPVASRAVSPEVVQQAIDARELRRSKRAADLIQQLSH